ncbi:hypothetical protein C8N25_1431 [Algoriphagus antarcticus]|uniref:Uncharacterized protein n=1 Tax=Algoriphagus antarcticus TaxID=238540 RepID=A0A3E0D6E4_9BACT|nr:hypothetical protein [Algoriphagus antarcticus]REG77501.1 hypothetical protein C8N25_1431 [Algoriphagus antarcticus]
MLEDKKVEVYGKEILRLADNFGKGWFALLLEEHIDHLTSIPDYILEAIAFASPHVNQQTLLGMAKFRLYSLNKQPYNDNKFDYQGVLEQVVNEDNPNNEIDFFKAQLPNDQLTSFINHLIL